MLCGMPSVSTTKRRDPQDTHSGMVCFRIGGGSAGASAFSGSFSRACRSSRAASNAAMRHNARWRRHQLVRWMRAAGITGSSDPHEAQPAVSPGRHVGVGQLAPCELPSPVRSDLLGAPRPRDRSTAPKSLQAGAGRPLRNRQRGGNPCRRGPRLAHRINHGAHRRSILSGRIPDLMTAARADSSACSARLHASSQCAVP